MVIFHDDDYYENRIPQPDLGPLRNFLRFIWDNERNAFLDRTAKEWGQLGIFYLCFFAVLGSIFAIQMKISIDYVSHLDKPFFQYAGLDSRTNSRFSRSTFASPGIAFKPNGISTLSPIIWVNDLTEKSRPESYIRALSEFLQGYERSASNYDSNCGERSRDGGEARPCFFDVKSLGKCGEPPYGYQEPLQPCVLIKFNKRFDWVPEYYNCSSDLPGNMPDKLKEIVRKSRKFHVWLSCDGANNVDKEHIGEIEYNPISGFPVEFFPFTGQLNYLSPIVALNFKNLTPNRLVTVECNLWALNIEQRSRYSLDFQIIISNTTGKNNS